MRKIIKGSQSLNINQLRMKHQRAGKTDVERLRTDTDACLSDYKPSDAIKYGEDRELEILGDVWAFVAENIEREAWKSYTREEWAELEREYVEKAEYTEPDLFDDILTKYERGLFTAEEAQAYAKRYRRCDYRFCLNVYKPRRKDQRYCSTDCRKREANAKIRFEKTGTYLPPHVYKENRDDTNERNYFEYEIAFNLGEAGNDEHEESAESVATRIYATSQKMLYGGRRDRASEDIYYKKVTEKDLTYENYPEYSDKKRHQNHVYSERSCSDKPFYKAL